MKFVVFDAEGILIRQGNCPDHCIALQARGLEVSMPWEDSLGVPTDYRLEGSRLVRISNDAD